MMTVNIMVDLETWGITPGCDIRSIGAVVFDPVSGKLGDEFYVNVYQGNLHGLRRDPDTIAWWEQQSVEAQERLLTDQQPLHHALTLFAEWWIRHDPCHNEFGGQSARFWAHGPHFDEAILAACYRAVGQPVPWGYRAPRDCRTIWDAAGGIDLPFEGTQHNALDDAKHQARCVIEAYRRINAVDGSVIITNGAVIGVRAPSGDSAQRLQDHMEQFHGVALSASEWDAAVAVVLGKGAAA